MIGRSGNGASGTPVPVVISWSSGKDAAYALRTLQKDPRFVVVGLLSTVTDPFHRVAMHGVRETLLQRQAAALGLPLELVRIPYPCPNHVYEERMAEVCQRLQRRGVRALAFGDLFLRDVRAYRESRLAGTGLTPIFPIWGRNTRRLAESMILEGFGATLVCVDPRKVPASWAGREFTTALLDAMPAGVDPCGENGEFHTFVHAGPIFAAPLGVAPGPVVSRDGFVFADLDSADGSSDLSSTGRAAARTRRRASPKRRAPQRSL